MQLGAVYPQTEMAGNLDAARRIGPAVEEMGYDYLLAYDHVLGAVHDDRTPNLLGPYTERDPFHDPFMLFAYLAGRTDRLRFATGVLILPQRQTVLVAKQAADLALLSNDRLRLGVGVGWNWVEYDSLGQEFKTRGARADEQIGLLRRLWSEEVVSFSGRFDTIDRAALVPRPLSPIPIWIGGFSEAALSRAARLGDGFIFTGASGAARSFAPEITLDWWNRIRQAVANEGRPVDQFGGELMIRLHRDPADAIRALEWWAEQGGTHASIVTLGLGLESVDAHLDYFAVAAELAAPYQTQAR